jgi:hypothetical protein
MAHLGHRGWAIAVSRTSDVRACNAIILTLPLSVGMARLPLGGPARLRGDYGETERRYECNRGSAAKHSSWKHPPPRQSASRVLAHTIRSMLACGRKPDSAARVLRLNQV